MDIFSNLAPSSTYFFNSPMHGLERLKVITTTQDAKIAFLNWLNSLSLKTV